MNVERKIERRMELTADEIYAALAKAYDLAPEGVSHFDMGGDTIRNHITLVNVHTYNQEIEAA